MKRAILILPVIYFSWIAMLAIHEFGHILHAWMSGGHIIGISFPVLGFSETIVDPNPHPLFVALGGGLWGTMLPTIAVMSCLLSRRKPHVLLWFFTGFCLISNGAYVGFGWIKRSGDAHDMMRQGMPVLVMIAFGFVCIVSGLICWHQLPSWSRKVVARGAVKSHP